MLYVPQSGSDIPGYIDHIVVEHDGQSILVITSNVRERRKRLGIVKLSDNCEARDQLTIDRESKLAWHDEEKTNFPSFVA